jgi:26S proteasome regulatory subunit N5
MLYSDRLTRTFVANKKSADLASNSRVLVHILKLCFSAKDYKLLNEHITLLSKKHGLLKQAVSKMVQEASTFVDKITDKATKLALIDTLRTVTDGKVRLKP